MAASHFSRSRCFGNGLVFLTLLASGAAMAVWAANAVGADDPPQSVPDAFKPRPLSRIAPGTTLFVAEQNGLSRILLFVKGRLAAGDVEAVSDTMRYYADLFNLVYVADAPRAADGRFRLGDVAVGFATGIKGRNVTVTAESADRLGAGLSLVGATVLAGNEEALRDITMTARNGSCAVVDAPSVVLFEKTHQKMDVRYFVWVSEADGRTGMAAWLLRRGDRRFEFAENSFQYLQPGMVEDRVMHVDKTRFLLGMPTAEAFAMVAIPQGRSFPVTARMRAIGGDRVFNDDTLRELAASLAEAMTKTELR